MSKPEDLETALLRAEHLTGEAFAGAFAASQKDLLQEEASMVEDDDKSEMSKGENPEKQKLEEPGVTRVDLDDDTVVEDETKADAPTVPPTEMRSVGSCRRTCWRQRGKPQKRRRQFSAGPLHGRNGRALAKTRGISV